MPGVVERATAKVGPLPVWAWALVILVGGYLAYRFTAGRSSSSSSSTTSAEPATQATDPGSLDLTPVGADTGSPPASSGQGGAADNLNSDLYGYLSGLQGSVDALTASVQMSPAFWPGTESGSSGSGSTVPNGQTPASPAAAAAAAKPAAKPAPPPASVRYYTYAPGKAPAARKQDEAPAKGPAGTTLHFKSGKGYFYA
jgi:hypothetical protein